MIANKWKINYSYSARLFTCDVTLQKGRGGHRLFSASNQQSIYILLISPHIGLLDL